MPPRPDVTARYHIRRATWPAERPSQVWTWQAERGLWRNAVGGLVEPALLAGRFLLEGPAREAAPSPTPPPAPRAAQQLSLF